ncbi:MAG: ThuA domain-containing protein [Candidatus Sumerlaeia bacterium]|nr:ThuA domain-containing protein [Candidatus Sumerlaeia bacterium]
MKKRIAAIMVCTVMNFYLANNSANRAAFGAESPTDKIRVLLTTGGHGFQEKEFFAFWNSLSEVTWREGKCIKSGEPFTPENLKNIDVIVAYDMAQGITADQQAAFKAFLARGGGLVATHHSIASWQDWPDYERIIGVKYFLKPAERDGKKYSKSGYKHDVNMKVHIADSKHPITRGLSDFEIRDETYVGYLVHPDVHVLLTTDEPTNEKTLMWTRQEGKARVVFYQLGHDNKAWTNSNYKTLLVRAIQWAAGQLN